MTTTNPRGEQVDDPAAPPTESAAASTASRWPMLVVLCLAAMMALFDATIVNVALPSLREGFGASESTLSWVVSGYTIAFALALIPGGRLGDRFGHRAVFLAGTTLFLLAAVGAAAAQNDAQLVVARLVHGAAGGSMMVPINAIVQLTFTGRDRVRAFGILGAGIAAAAAVGPLVGGATIDAIGVEDGWRSAFLVGLPLGLVALVAAVPLLRVPHTPTRGRFDLVGMALLIGASVAVLVPLIERLPSWSWASFALAAVLAGLLTGWERRVHRLGTRVPVLPVGAFASPRFSWGLLINLLATAAFTSALFISLAALWQGGRGETALAASLLTLSFTVGNTSGSLLTRITNRAGETAVPIATAMLFGGLLVTYLLLRLDAGIGALELAPALFVAGLGAGVFMPANLVSMLAGVPNRDAGAAAGTTQMAGRIGASIGGAVVVIVVYRPGADLAATSLDGLLACLLLALAALVVAVLARWVAPVREASS